MEGTKQTRPGSREVRAAEKDWRKKFLTLQRECDLMEQANDILYAKSRQIYKMIQGAETEKKMLMKRLEKYESEAQDSVAPAGKKAKMADSLPTSPLSSRAGSVANLQDMGQSLLRSDHSTYPPMRSTLPLSSSAALSPALLSHRLVPPLLLKPPLLHQTLLPPSLPTPSPSSSTHTSPKTTKRQIKGAKGSPASRRRKGDDSGAPKKPSNAFFWFCQEQRSGFEDRFRGEGVAGQHSLTKILAQKWAETTAEDKKKYYLKYGVDKKRYEMEMQAYQTRKLEEQKRTASLTAISSDAG